jgi:hypothetical protein
MNIEKLFLLNKTELIKYLFISLIIALLSSNVLTIEHPLYISIITLLIFFIIIVIQIKRDEKKDKQNNNNNIEDIVKQEEGFRIITKLCENNKISDESPFENLTEEEIKDKLNYLYYATSHPFKPNSYSNWKKTTTHYNINPSNSVKHLEISKKDYPDLSSDQINADDCMNHKSTPLSCNQKSPMILNSMIKEDFSKPKSLLKNINIPLFKNIPNNSIIEGKPYDSSEDLCSSCVV